VQRGKVVSKPWIRFEGKAQAEEKDNLDFAQRQPVGILRFY